MWTAEDEWTWMRPPCCMCDCDRAHAVNKCGPMCYPCLEKYRADYLRYKQEPCAKRQIRLRRRFADRWFMGDYDDDHSWSLTTLAQTGKTPEFVFCPSRMR
jgi:hypothetical protein